jgi:hypothetical protein
MLNGPNLEHRRATLSVVACLLAVAGVLTFAGASVAGGSGCADGNFCAWEGTNYTGQKVTDDNYDGRWVEIHYRGSAKNRFGNRRVRLGNATQTGVNVVTCMNPGGERPDLAGTVDVYYIGVLGSRC